MKSTKLAALIAAATLSACASGPEYKRPQIDVPETWSGATERAAQADSTGQDWWLVFQDDVLDRLEAEALEKNQDIKLAAARVQEARARTTSADADRQPSVTAGFSGSRSQVTQVGPTPLPADWPRNQNDYRGTVNVSYELDFWGKYSRASEAARAELLGSEFSRDAVHVAVTAKVAESYFALLAAEKQERIVHRTLDSRREVLAAFKKYRDAGVYSDYDLRQAEAEEAKTRSQLAAATNGKQQAEGALSLILGRSPREIMTTGVQQGSPAPSTDVVVPAGLPSELLLHRPDLREAEQKLIAANARIGAAQAMFFPSVGLTAAFGTESASLSSLFIGPTGIFSFVASATQPIWNGGRIKAGVEVAEAQQQQALAQYRQTVANAFLDVRSALSAQTAARDTLLAEGDRIEALSRASKQAQLGFKAGLNTRLEVLDAERNLLDAELNSVEAARAYRVAVVSLFKALGGGWTTMPKLAHRQ